MEHQPYRDGLQSGNLIAATTNKIPNSLEVIPNPVQSKATIKFYSVSNQKIFFALKSVNGQAILSKRFNAVKGSNSYNFYTGNLAKGIYIVTLKTNEGLLTIKVEKQ